MKSRCSVKYIKKHKKTFKKHKNTLKNPKKTFKKHTKTLKTHKKGGGLFNFVNLISKAGLVLTLLGSACGKTHIMTACAGNTCRSPVGEFYTKSILGNQEGIGDILSRGVSVREANSPMAPYSSYFAKEICGNNEDCKKEVDEHKSKSFSCEEILSLIEEPGAILRIIPMDNTTSDKIFDILSKCGLTPEQQKKIIVGLNCDSKGVCERKSAEIPDPFFQRKTPYEHASYVNMVDAVKLALSNDLKTCPNYGI